MATTTAILNRLLEYKPNVCSSMEEVQELDIACKSLLQRYLDCFESVQSSDQLKIQAVIDYMYEQVNIGHWKEVRIFLRKTITIASYLKLIALIKFSDKIANIDLKESFKIIDFGIMFGCPIDKEPNLLQLCAAVLNPLNPKPDSSPKEQILSHNGSKNVLTDYLNTIPIEVLDCPSMEHLYANYIMKEKPVILDSCMKEWPALKKWQDQNYFIKLAGLRTVSIELGKEYTDSDWTQKLMTIEEFIKNHIYESNGPVGYMAQYQLFQQIPELKNDIIEPEYCCFAGTDDPVDIMAWYGPKGTVSPLHHDPKKNLLAQVIGEKQLFLFSPKDSEFLYPHEHELLNNTARVDPRKPDLTMFPKYKEAKAYYCVLRPGQMLYIPPKWWHFVESLSISFSVSFWWE